MLVQSLVNNINFLYNNNDGIGDDDDDEDGVCVGGGL